MIREKKFLIVVHGGQFVRIGSESNLFISWSFELDTLYYHVFCWFSHILVHYI